MRLEELKWSARVTTAHWTVSPQIWPPPRSALTWMVTLKVPPGPYLDVLARVPPKVLLIQCEAPVVPDWSEPPRQGVGLFAPCAPLTAQRPTYMPLAVLKPLPVTVTF